MCHTPSGASINQVMHYAQEIRFGFFGRYMVGNEIPADFDLSRITSPISLHFSPIDSFTSAIDVDKLTQKLKNSVVLVQQVNEFNHVDFITGINAATIVYPEILKFFNNYELVNKLFE